MQAAAVVVLARAAHQVQVVQAVVVREQQTRQTLQMAQTILAAAVVEQVAARHLARVLMVVMVDQALSLSDTQILLETLLQSAEH
jgi:hypothetical protein